MRTIYMLAIFLSVVLPSASAVSALNSPCSDSISLNFVHITDGLAALNWTPVAGVDSFNVSVLNTTEGTVIFQGFVADTTLMLNDLIANNEYEATVSYECTLGSDPHSSNVVVCKTASYVNIVIEDVVIMLQGAAPDVCGSCGFNTLSLPDTSKKLQLYLLPDAVGSRVKTIFKSGNSANQAVFITERLTGGHIRISFCEQPTGTTAEITTENVCKVSLNGSLWFTVKPVRNGFYIINNQPKIILNYTCNP